MLCKYFECRCPSRESCLHVTVLFFAFISKVHLLSISCIVFANQLLTPHRGVKVATLWTSGTTDPSPARYHMPSYCRDSGEPCTWNPVTFFTPEARTQMSLMLSHFESNFPRFVTSRHFPPRFVLDVYTPYLNCCDNWWNCEWVKRQGNTSVDDFECLASLKSLRSKLCVFVPPTWSTERIISRACSLPTLTLMLDLVSGRSLSVHVCRVSAQSSDSRTP